MKRTVFFTVAAVLVVLLAAGGAAVFFASRITDNSVPIVAATGVATSSTLVPAPSLPVITGEPADIGEDYDEPTPAPTVTPVPSGTAALTQEPAPSPKAEPIYQKIPIDKNVINILIIGRDARPNQTGNGRSDTMMILSWNRKEGKASIVSLMRDTWVPIKGYDWNRLNAAYSFGGIGLAVNTINGLFDLDIQNYIVVNFDAMTQLVDRIGGIDVPVLDVEAAYYRSHFGWDVSAGEQHLDGEHALIHARNRKSNGGDFERVRRQQDILLAIYQKMKEKKDPALLAQFIGFAMENVKTNISADMLFSLALELVEKGGIDIRKGRVPKDKTWSYANKDGRSVITIDFIANRKYLHDLIYSED